MLIWYIHIWKTDAELNYVTLIFIQRLGRTSRMEKVTMSWRHGPLARYVKSRVTHAPGVPGTFSPPPWVSDPDMHHGTCVTHVPWCMPGSLTIGFLWSRWWGKRSRHSRRMCNPQSYISDKRPIMLMCRARHSLMQTYKSTPIQEVCATNSMLLPGSHFPVCAPVISHTPFHDMSYIVLHVNKVLKEMKVMNTYIVSLRKSIPNKHANYKNFLLNKWSLPQLLFKVLLYSVKLLLSYQHQ